MSNGPGDTILVWKLKVSADSDTYGYINVTILLLNGYSVTKIDLVLSSEPTRQSESEY